MFGVNENPQSMLLYLGTSEELSQGFYSKIHRKAKDYCRLDDTDDNFIRVLVMAELWVEDYIKHYQKVALAGEGIGGMVANIIAHELNLPALLINPVAQIAGFDFPINNPQTVEILLQKDKKLSVDLKLPKNWDISTEPFKLPEKLPNSWDIHYLGGNEKNNQEILDWAMANICENGWAEIDDGVWFDEK